jgi:hypothetical protein
MTGDVIPLHGDPCQAIQALLPWYVTGRLGAAEQAEVEAHLAGCPECQAELRAERRLCSEVAALPLDIEQGWASLRSQIEREEPVGAAPVSILARRRPRGPWLIGGAIAAQVGVVAVLGAVLANNAQVAQRKADYHVLGATQPAPVGNAVVMFRPDTPERALREALQASHARLVDGPTAADAYVLRIPPAERAQALARLKARPEVSLAEPVDAGGSNR